jgi:hypothetical protein
MVEEVKKGRKNGVLYRNFFGFFGFAVDFFSKKAASIFEKGKRWYPGKRLFKLVIG